MDVRADIVKWAMWAVQNKKRFHYLQARPFTYRLTAPINIDCSGFVGWCYKQAGAFDPYQRQHKGIGYTGTLIELGKKLIIPRLQVKPGDIVVYSVDRPTSEQHTAIVVQGGKDPLTVSMGQEGDPSLVHVSQDPRKPTFYRFPTGKCWPSTPFPPNSVMDIQSWNFWIGFFVTCGFAVGFIWGGVKWYNQTVASLITKRLKEGERRAQIEALNVRFTDLEKTLNAVRKDITPNGKNTQRLGDIAARSEEKIDNLMAFMERYAVKVDGLEREIAAHLGYHNGAEL